MSQKAHMASRNDAVRRRRFEADEKSLKVSEIEGMICEFERLAADLELQVQAEEARTGIKDPQHCSYSMYATAAACRRDNLRASAANLREKLQAAMRERDEAVAAAAAVSATSDAAAAVSVCQPQDRVQARSEQSSGVSLR